MNISAEQIVFTLGGRQTLGRSVRNMRELDALVRDGIPRAALDCFLKLLARSDAVPPLLLRQKIVPRATYQRALTLNTQVSETTERLARLYALALSVFEDPNAVVAFLMSPHPELGNRSPFDVALTEIGGREVEEVIERGLHGLPA